MKIRILHKKSHVSVVTYYLCQTHSHFIEVLKKKLLLLTDRTPSDVGMKIHNKYDELFYEKFGRKARSEGVFASGYKRKSYGKSYMFFPVNGYKFIWSPAIFDLYTSRFNFITNVVEGFRTYTDENLQKAVLSGNEIIFKCKAYWLVNIDDAGLGIIHEIGKLNKNEHFTYYSPQINSA